MKKNLWTLVLLGYLVMTIAPIGAGEQVPPKGSKWDVVKDYLRKDSSRPSGEVSSPGMATDTVSGVALEKNSKFCGNVPTRPVRLCDAESCARQTYKLEHNGYAPYQEFLILDMITKERKAKLVGFLPEEARFFYLSPSSPKIPLWVKVGKARVSRNGFSFKIGSPDGSEVFSFFDSTDEVAPWFFEKYTKTPESNPTSSASEPTTLEMLRKKLNALKVSHPPR